MPEYEIGQTDTTDFDGSIQEISIPSEETDAASGDKETEYVNSDWSNQLGLYHNEKAPELKKVIDAKATWMISDGVKGDPTTMFILDSMKGNGSDTFNTIIENMIRTYQVGGDAFAEQVRDDDNSLINLKPLDTGIMKIVANPKGIIIRYEMMSKTSKQVEKTFQPEEIFHLCRNRIADEIHGQSLCKSLKWIIETKSEAMEDWRTVVHRTVWPLIILESGTDDTVKINTLKTEWKNAISKKEAIIAPKGTTKDIKELTAASKINVIQWLEYLDNRFYEAAGVPKIVVGGVGGITEAAVKIAYLSFENTVREEQLQIIEQVGKQLGLSIQLDFPISLQNELLSDNSKDATNGAAQPNETTAGSGA